MKLECLHCGTSFEGTISKDELGWHSVCPECEQSFDVDVPEGRYLMVFADKTDSESPYECFTDMPEIGITAYFAFNSASDLVRAWYDYFNSETSFGMWYWVIDTHEGAFDGLITNGACGDEDIMYIYEHLGLFPVVDIVRSGEKMNIPYNELQEGDYIPLWEFTVCEYDRDTDEITDEDGDSHSWYELMH